MALLALQLAIGGLALGSAAALSGLGLVVTYRATGVFNLAQGAVATLAAYVFWQLQYVDHVPTVPAAAVAVLGVGPAIGLLAERLVFRPLQRRSASPAETLVATLGLFVVLTGVVAVVWGQDTISTVPLLLPDGSWTVTKNLVVDQYDVWSLLVLLALAGGIGALFRWTRLGSQISAVVDRRELAELSGIDTNRVSAFSWALGCSLAALTGLLLLGVASGLDDYTFTLIALETVAVAVIARLVSLPLAVVGGLALYVVQSELTLPVFHLTRAPWISLRTELASVALLAFLVLYRRLDELGTTAPQGTGRLVTGRLGEHQHTNLRNLAPIALLAVVSIGFPFIARQTDLQSGQQVIALYVAFLSITAITGLAGYVNLGTAGFAGLGGFVAAKVADGTFPGVPKLPVILAMALAAAVCAAVGFAAGYPALRRRGLILGLVTLAVNLILYRLVFGQATFTLGIQPERPDLFGLHLTGDRAYYWFELAVAAGTSMLVNNLRTGRLGRVLAAMRDSEAGAQSVGISLRRHKLFIFSVSAGLAGVGGALLAQQSLAFNPDDYQPLYSLFWFTAVVVAGLSTLSGAGLAAVLYVGLDSLLGRAGASQLVIGAAALAIGFLPGGLVGSVSRLRAGSLVPASLLRRYDEALTPPAPARPRPAYVPTETARRLLAASRGAPR